MIALLQGPTRLPRGVVLGLTLWTSLGWTACSGGQDRAGQPSRFQVGYAQVVITPPVGTILGGYGVPGQGRRATGTHDPLLAQAALFVNDLGQAFLVISVDLVGYMWDFGEWGPGVKSAREAIAQALQSLVPIEPEHILIASSHSHAAPDLVGLNQDFGQGPDKTLLADMQRWLTGVAVAAARDLRDAELWFGTTELVGLSARDMNCSPVLDNSVAIVQARRATGEVLFTIANYAKHPTIAPESNRLFSADFIWGYREEMERATGAPAMFLQGFVAAVHGLYSFYEGPDLWDRVREIGSALARVVLAAPMTKATQYDIRHRAATYSCACDEDTFLAIAFSTLGMPKRSIAVGTDGRVHVSEIEVSWHQLGPAEFVVFPGEPSPEYGLMAKQRLTSPFRFVVGLGNDSIGYMVEPESMANDPTGRLAGYERRMGLGSESGPTAWNVLRGLIESGVTDP